MGKALSTTKGIRERTGEVLFYGFVPGVELNWRLHREGRLSCEAGRHPFVCRAVKPRDNRVGLAAIVTILFLAFAIQGVAFGDTFEESPPYWEPLLWGGKVGKTKAGDRSSVSLPQAGDERQSQPPRGSSEAGQAARVSQVDPSQSSQAPAPETEFVRTDLPMNRELEGLKPLTRLPKTATKQNDDYFAAPLQPLTLKNIPPLYVTPHLQGEGAWEWRGMPTSPEGSPAVYRTSYRPSVRYPNAVVHMLLFDMRRLSMRLYVGSTEPGAPRGASMVEPETRPGLVAITNALWKQKHSGEAGNIFRGNVLKRLFPGMATLAVYKDGSVDVLEWNEGIPTSLISDARQLKHLIVKDGKVVDSIVKGGQRADSEIGLGYLLSEDESAAYPSYWGYGYYGGYGGGGQPTHTSGDEWFIATRSAFGIRKDGNLVFAIGHHISTKDLAKALVLAGCERAMHGDANPHNVLGNLYYNPGNGDISKRGKLSPDQKNDTLNRYVDRSYTSDFFAFFTKNGGRDS